jgi:hypothetical protein
VEAFGNLDNAELVKLMSAGMALAELKGIDSVRNEMPAVFAEATPAATVAATQHIHIHMPEGMVQVAPPSITVTPPNITFGAPSAPNVQVDVHVPQQTPAAIEVTLQPSPVTINNTHPAQAIQTVERDANDEIVRTVTTFQTN